MRTNDLIALLVLLVIAVAEKKRPEAKYYGKADGCAENQC